MGWWGGGVYLCRDTRCSVHTVLYTLFCKHSISHTLHIPHISHTQSISHTHRGVEKNTLAATLSGSKPASSKAIHKKQGRFDVWEGDTDDMPPTTSLGEGGASKLSLTSEGGEGRGG